MGSTLKWKDKVHQRSKNKELVCCSDINTQLPATGYNNPISNSYSPGGVSMKRTEAQTHFIELLLTLDYLLNYTDENHPATQQDICRHAKDFGLKYDSKNPVGNDVRRQRIGDCLQFLQFICNKYKDTDQIPFVINCTDKGKFYLEEKNHLNEEQIIKILAAIQNDKYTQDEDTDLLIEKLLDSLSNRYNREQFKQELRSASKGVRKYDFATNRKMRLVSKALKEGKLLKIRHELKDPNGVGIHVYDIWYRVYKIQEFKNKPYATLLPVSTRGLHFFKKMMFGPVENFNIPNGPDKEVLAQDLAKRRDMNELFARCNEQGYLEYHDIDKLLEANVMPVSGEAYRMAFYFDLQDEEVIQRSFEETFSRPLPYTECVSFDVAEEKNRSEGSDVLVPHPLKEGEKPRYGVVNVFLNTGAFLSWVLSDPRGNGRRNIGDLITIVYPDYVKERLASYYLEHLIAFKDGLNDAATAKAIAKLQDK